MTKSMPSKSTLLPILSVFAPMNCLSGTSRPLWRHILPFVAPFGSKKRTALVTRPFFSLGMFLHCSMVNSSMIPLQSIRFSRASA